MTDQQQLFQLGTSLLDCSLEQRAAAAAQVLEADPDLSVDDRRRLLLLVVAPTIWSEVER